MNPQEVDELLEQGDFREDSVKAKAWDYIEQHTEGARRLWKTTEGYCLRVQPIGLPPDSVEGETHADVIRGAVAYIRDLARTGRPPPRTPAVPAKLTKATPMSNLYALSEANVQPMGWEWRMAHFQLSGHLPISTLNDAIAFMLDGSTSALPPRVWGRPDTLLGPFNTENALFTTDHRTEDMGFLSHGIQFFYAMHLPADVIVVAVCPVGLLESYQWHHDLTPNASD